MRPLAFLNIASVALGMGLLLMFIDASPDKTDDGIATFSMISRLPGVALSAPYLEPRTRLYRDFSTTLLPGLPPIDNMGFVYAH